MIWTDKKAVAADLKVIYCGGTLEVTEPRLTLRVSMKCGATSTRMWASMGMMNGKA